jgi:hypothetical protein
MSKNAGVRLGPYDPSAGRAAAPRRYGALPTQRSTRYCKM